MKRLYIIGNGFDLYHGLPTSYKCFNCFMCRKFPKVHDLIGSVFDPKDTSMLWCNFEEKLGEPDVLALVDWCLTSMVNEKELDVDNDFDGLNINLNSYFQEWVKQIKMSCANSKRLRLDDKAYYINFNYTCTLDGSEEQKGLYQINPKQICYIHGDTGKNPYRKPIVGHGKTSCDILKSIGEKSTEIKNKILGSQKLPSWAETKDDLEEKIICKICRFLKELKKTPIDNISNGEEFFEKCAKSDEIYVLGHSLADVDLPYFEKIARESDTAKWYVSYYDDIESIKKQIGKIHNIGQVEFITLDELKVNGDKA